MNDPRNPLRGIAHYIFLHVFVYTLGGCGFNEFRIQEERLKPLVEHRASREELLKVCGTNFLMYAKNQTNWIYISQYMKQESAIGNIKFHQYAEKWPMVMLYSTSDMMTWVFLDQDEKVAAIIVGAQ